MSKKRLFLSAVIAVCACTIVYAIVRPREFLQDIGAAEPELAQPQEARRAEIRNFSMPHVSEAGVTEWIAKGERAVQTSANTYDVTKIVIEMFAGVNPETGEQRIVRLTGDTGAINHSSKQAMLRENVVARLDKHTTLRTSQLLHDPADNTLKTDQPMQ